MENLELYERYRSVPDEAKKPINGGRLKGKTDINPMWRIKALTEAFGPCGIGWYYKLVNKWMERHGEEVAAFVDIELYVKHEGEWSKPIPGTGGSMFVAEEKNGPYVSDECYKMATTDAISVACKQLGFGADVYWSSDRSKYDTREQEFETDPRKVRVEANHINTIFVEMQRTGITESTLKNMYKVKDLHELNMAQFKDIMEKFRNTADKPAAPVAPPDPPMDNDANLPWNTPTR